MVHGTDLPVTPYKSYNNQTDAIVKLPLRKADFNNVPFQDGKIVLSFNFCRYGKFIINNIEEIGFQDISIAFFSCIIDDFEIQNLISKNITIGFYGCVVSGAIRNENILSVELNNCILRSNFFIIGVQNAIVKFTKENRQLYNWKKMFIQHRIHSYADLLKKQGYHISECKNIQVSANQDLFREKNRFNLIGLSVSYSSDVSDIETTIADIQLVSLSISENPSGKVSLQNVKIGSWYINNFIPTGQVSFYNIEPSPIAQTDIKIGINQCNLDGVWFDNVAFDKYPVISFYRTKFSKAIFTACNFPDSYTKFSRFMPVENVHYTDQIPANFHKDQYEIFLQLKKSLEDTGNYYEALKLQAISHDALKKISTLSLWDRMILTINSWSNDHGLSIKRPFIGFLVCSALAYILYLLSLGRIFNSHEIDPTLFGYYFSFVDITHRPDFLVGQKDFTGWSLFLDYVNKLIVSFFIFQFIAAFRKYGKK